jgi:hypothetical protein
VETCDASCGDTCYMSCYELDCGYATYGGGGLRLERDCYIY